MRAIIILSILLLVGCSAQIKYINQTVVKEIIKVCPENNCVCNPAACTPPACNCNYEEVECKTAIKTVVTDKCTQKLTMCNIFLDQTNDLYSECLQENNTGNYESLKDNYTECIWDRDEYKEELEKIKELVS